LDGAGGGPVHRRERAQVGGLAAAVRTYQAHRLAGAYLEGERMRIRLSIVATGFELAGLQQGGSSAHDTTASKPSAANTSTRLITMARWVCCGSSVGERRTRKPW